MVLPVTTCQQHLIRMEHICLMTVVVPTTRPSYQQGPVCTNVWVLIFKIYRALFLLLLLWVRRAVCWVCAGVVLQVGLDGCACAEQLLVFRDDPAC